MADIVDSPDLVGGVPAWMLAADNHNIGNSGGSWFDPSTWGEKLGDASHFVIASLLSGTNSFYNTGVAIKNVFSPGTEERETGAWITSIDSDLGAYYDKNRQAVDLAGFIAGSIVPGMAGVKILHAGQAALTAAAGGRIGTNLSRATGLLVPRTSYYVESAIKDLRTTQAQFALINSNVAKALGSGLWQNTLESAAFETMAQATMFKAPTLEDQHVSDIVANIALGGIVGGVLGGVFTGVKSYRQLKRGLIAEDADHKAYSDVVTFWNRTPAAEKLVLSALQRDLTPPVRLEADLAAKDAAAMTSRNATLSNNMRTYMHELTGTDVELGNHIADTHVTMNGRAIASNFLDVAEIARLNQPTAVERALREAAKQLDYETMATHSVRYQKLYGPDVGTVIEGRPHIVNLADMVVPKAGQTTRQLVMEAVKDYGFKANVAWDATKLTGHNAHFEAEARYLWAQYHMPASWFSKAHEVNEFDIPLLQRYFELGTFPNATIVRNNGTKETIADGMAFQDFLAEQKKRAARELLINGKFRRENKADAVAKIVDARRQWLEGQNSANIETDIFARRTNQSAYRDWLVSQGIKQPGTFEPGEALVEFTPTWAKLAYKLRTFKDVDGHVIDGITWAKMQQGVFENYAKNVFAMHAGRDVASIMPELTDSIMYQANRFGAGPGVTSFAGGKYTSDLEAFVNSIGGISHRLRDSFKQKAKDELNPLLVRLAQDQHSTIEWEELNRKVAQSPEHYVYVPDASEYGFDFGPALIFRRLKEAVDGAGEEGLKHDVTSIHNVPEHIPINNKLVSDLAAAHQAIEGRRTTIGKDIASFYGKENKRHTEIFRPVRPSYREYPHFFFVVDDRVTGVGHVSMVHASTAEELAALKAKVPPEYRTLTKSESQEYYRARQEYDAERAMNENYIDSDLRSRGVNAPFFIQTDPVKVADKILQYHMRHEDVIATELVRMRYQRQFDWLEQQGRQYANLEASRYGSTLERVEQYEKNPYISYIKAALDINRASENQQWWSLNRAVDGAISNVVTQVKNIFTAAKTPEELAGINTLLKAYGYNNAYYNAALNIHANHTAGAGALSNFVRTANSVLARFTLGMDPMNALNNIVGANVLRGTELKFLTDAIAKGDTELAGKLAEIAKLRVPGTEDMMLSPTKLHANAIRNFFGPQRESVIQGYIDRGYVSTIMQQFHSVLDDIALKGTESAAELLSRQKKLFVKARYLADIGEKYSGNSFAEEYNRFISADVMRQLTEPAVQKGLLTPAEQHAITATFVNRVEGNILASQRPLLFAGPIGHAIGLFQSYQFNLMQNLFRYIGEGRAKDLAMLGGLQTTMYGINGMPAFQFMNTHIVGTLSGNQNHRDLYDAAFGIAGKEGGEFLLYGLPSYITQSSLYTRGDINPRQLTIIPTSLSEIPVVGAMSKFFAGVRGAVSNIANGGNVWESVLQGLEHNGISRPLAGVAQVMQGIPGGTVYSTSTRGTIMGQNDLFSLASFVRLAGGRPLDEAVVNDSVYRITAYEAMDRNRQLALSSAVKTAVIAGNIPDSEQVATFAEQYAALGGKQHGFNRWMMDQYKKANISHAQQLAARLHDPLVQKVQMLMGGME